MRTAENYRRTIQEVFNTVSGANHILQLMLPDEKKKPMNDEVAEIVKRMAILEKIDERLVFIEDFNKRLAVFDKNLTDLEDWLGEGRRRLDGIKNPAEILSPEDRVTKTMEVQEDINKKSEFCAKQEAEKVEIFPKQGEKMSKDAKKYNDGYSEQKSFYDRWRVQVRGQAKRGEVGAQHPGRGHQGRMCPIQ